MSTEIDIFKDYLKQKNQRWTSQRQTVLETFLNMEGHIETEELFAETEKSDPSIGIATVYRTVKLMVECGLARENPGLNGRSTFEKAYRQGHHDHLVCTGCGKVVEFEHPLIEKLQLEVCSRAGFSLQTHRMELYGLCNACREASAYARPGKKKK